MKWSMNTAIQKMSSALDCDYLFALGLFMILDEMRKDGRENTPITDRTIFEFGYMSTKMSHMLSTKKSGQIWDIYRDTMTDIKRDIERDKKRTYRERKRRVPSSPSSPTPLSPPISPSEKERDIPPCHTSYDIPLKGKDSQTRTRRSSTDYSDEFNTFWAIYPRKVDKTSAWKAWRTLNPDEETQNAIKTDIKHRLEREWRGKDMTYIPHPATYLNKRRWEDETEVTRVAKPEPTDEDLFAGLTPEQIALYEQLANDGEHWG